MRNHASFMIHDIDVEEEPYEFRLPEEIRPIHYDLQVEFDAQLTKFNGIVTILFNVLEPIRYVALHARSMNVQTEVVQRADFRLVRRNCEDYHSFFYKKFEYWITWFQNKLKEGEYQIRLRFNGNIDERQIGLFTSTYSGSSESEAEAQKILATRCTPTFARFVFPCFDEPEMKATFNITLIYPDALGCIAVSNTKIEKTSLKHNNTEVQFYTTSPMSPHMLAFVIANFTSTTQRLSASLTRTFEMRIFTQHGKIHLAEYALSWSHFMIDHLTDYFDFPYPLHKLDIVAMPHLTIGMAEHWGLLYFDESLLLYDENVNTSANKQRIAMLIAHAMARMWLGGLVTLTWWNQLWISKGLTTYMEYKCVHELEPDWGMMDQFLITELYPVMAIDAAGSHPLSKRVDDISQIAAAFDKVTIMKGAAIARMLENLVGAEFFRRELTKYIRKYAYGNAEAEDFINVLQAGEPDVPLEKIMNSFKEQKGLPFVKVTRLVQKNGFRLAQQRFLSDPEDYQHKLRSSKIFFNWTIPITYITSNSAEIQHSVFPPHERYHALALPDDEPVDWIKVNKDNIGYYRVNYSDDLWQNLTTVLLKDPKQLSISDRAQLLSDCFAFANTGLLSFKIALELTAYIWQETEFVPWYVAANELKNISKKLRGTELHDDFLSYAKNLVQDIYRKTSWTDDLTHSQNLKRVTIFDAACAFGLTEALDDAGELFTAWLQNSNLKILPDIKGIVLIYGMQHVGNTKSWQVVWDRFMVARDPTERRRLLHSLCTVQNHRTLSDLLQLILETKGVSEEEIIKCFSYVSCNVSGRDVVWNYVRKSWANLMERFGKTNFRLSHLIPEITAEFKTHKELDELQDFIDDNNGEGMSTNARDEAINGIECNIYWQSHNTVTLREWLGGQILTDSFHTADNIFNTSQTSL